MSSSEGAAYICAMCRAEKTADNNEMQVFSDEMLVSDNYKSKNSVTSTDARKYQQRVVYLENLLAANLDNLTTSQKY